jgi:hypothetical protein
VIVASGGGAGVAVWIVLWIVSIALGIWLYSKCPKLPGMDPVAGRARNGVLVAGFLPCFGINIVSQFILFGVYKAKAGSASKYQELNKRFQNTGGFTPPSTPPARPAAPGANPFGPSGQGGGSAAPPPRSGPSSDNPFA